MSGALLFGWSAAALWATWSFAAQGWLGAASGGAAWVPDLGLALLVVLSSKLPRAELPWLALLFGAARCAVSIDPPVANLTVALGVVALARAVRGVIEVQSAIPRAVLAFLCALGAHGWLELTHSLRLRGGALGALGAQRALEPAAILADAWPTALATALTVLALGELLARLPGLTPLWRRKTWHLAASPR